MDSSRHSLLSPEHNIGHILPVLRSLNVWLDVVGMATEERAILQPLQQIFCREVGAVEIIEPGGKVLTHGVQILVVRTVWPDRFLTVQFADGVAGRCWTARRRRTGQPIVCVNKLQLRHESKISQSAFFWWGMLKQMEMSLNPMWQHVVKSCLPHKSGMSLLTRNSSWLWLNEQ